MRRIVEDGYSIKTTIDAQYHDNILDCLANFIREYKIALEAGYVYLNSLQIIYNTLSQLKLESAKLAKKVHGRETEIAVGLRFIAETAQPALLHMSINTIILSVTKIVETPQHKDDRSLHWLVTDGDDQGYISPRLKTRFDSLKQKHAPLLEQAKNVRDKLIAHSTSSFAETHTALEDLQVKGVNALLTFLKKDITSFYKQLVKEICPNKYITIYPEHKKYVSNKTDVSPANVEKDLKILDRVYKEHWRIVEGSQNPEKKPRV